MGSGFGAGGYRMSKLKSFGLGARALGGSESGIRSFECRQQGDLQVVPECAHVLCCLKAWFQM